MSGRENPARWNERAATEETVLVIDGGHPWVRLYGCERASHDFMPPPLWPFTTRQLCSGHMKVSERTWQDITTQEIKCILRAEFTSINNWWSFCRRRRTYMWTEQTFLEKEKKSNYKIFEWFFIPKLYHTFRDAAELPHNPPPFSDKAPWHQALVRISVNWEWQYLKHDTSCYIFRSQTGDLNHTCSNYGDQLPPNLPRGV